MALPKIHRLKRRQDFSRIYQSGLRRSTAHLTLRAVQKQFIVRASEASQENCQRSTAGSAVAKEVRPTQLGISISQKVSKRAVTRNRIKRQIRAAFRQLLPRLTAGWQVVIVVKPNATECGYEQFLQELKQLLINAEVMDGH